MWAAAQQWTRLMRNEKAKFENSLSIRDQVNGTATERTVLISHHEKNCALCAHDIVCIGTVHNARIARILAATIACGIIGGRDLWRRRTYNLLHSISDVLLPFSIC